MTLNKDLISQFVKITNDDKPQIKEATVNATVIKVDGIDYVKIDGSDRLTPATTTAMVEDNERVTVTIKDHTAVINGNYSSPAVRQETVEKIVENVTEEFGSVRIELADIEQAIIKKADIDYLTANYARILNGYIDTAQIQDASIGTAQIADAAITTAKIQNAFVDSLVATQGKFQSAHIGQLTSDNISADTIRAEHIAAQVIEAINLNVTDKISADRIDVNSLVVDDIDAGKITTGTLDADRIKSSVIEAINFSTDTAQINSAKIGDIDASKITTGSLDADLITANVIAAINASVGKISADRIDVDSITVNNLDASVITTGDLNAERIKAQVIAAINSYTGTARIKQAQIETLKVGSANITDLDVSKLTGDKIDAKFIDTDNLEVDFANITGTLTADKIKGGTLDAKNMTVTNLNAASITVGQINGNQIASGAISKEKFDSVLSGEWNSVMNEVDDILEENGLIKEQVEVVQNKVDNLEIGGRNLLKDTLFDKTLNSTYYNQRGGVYSLTIDTENKHNNNNSLKIKSNAIGSSGTDVLIKTLGTPTAGSKYTLSFYAKSLEDTTLTARWGYGGVSGTALISPEWKRYVIFIPSGAQIYQDIFIYFDKITEVFIATPKLEKGNKPTDWTPAPEDAVENIEAVKVIANSAQTSANTANNLLSDLSNDNKLTAVEKQETKKEWDIIVSEKSKIESNANSYGITTELTNYTNAYNTLNTYITPLLSSLNTTSDIVGSTFRTNFKNYYDRRQDLLNAITTKAKTLADNAQSSVNNLEIGGRNLLSNSIFNYPTNYSGWSYNSTYTNIDTTKTFNGHNTLKVSVSGLTADQWVGATSTGLSRRTFKAGETVTISCWYYVEDKTTITDRISIGIQGILGTETSAREFASGQIMLSNIVQGSWTKHSLTYTFPSDAKDVIYRCWVKRNGTAWFADFKFEMGSKATDWSPAPEDTNTQIQTVTSIANGKNTIYYATSAPSITGKKVDDIWFDTDDGNRIYRFTGSAWSAAQFGQNALAANSITANHIVSGTISAGKLAADSVVASNIAADAVVARNIKAGEVTAGKLAVNAVVAGNIAANAVTSDKINAKAITAEKLDVAEIWADSGFIQQFSATSIDATQITTGKISGDRIDINGLVSYEALDTDLQPLFDVTSGKTYINGGMLAANTIKANSIDLLSGITVTGPDNNITFSIEDNGEVTINGLMRSGNYDEEKKTGYRLTTDGKAILNNATVRGVVELPNAGMTNDYDMGQTEGRNLVLGTAVPTVVASQTENNYQYASFEYGAKPNTTYTMSFNVKILTGSFTKLTVYGSYANNSGTVDIVNGRCVYTFTTPTTLDNGSTNPSIWKKALIYAGASGATSGNSIEISKLKIEEGSTATDWTPAPEDNINPVRIWAGGSYELRDSAPFRVLQNGDVYATNATLSGILYGSVDSGSVHINDNHLTIVNDTVTPTVEYFYAGTEDVRVNTDFMLGTPNSPRLSYSNDDRILSINDSTTVIDTNNLNLTFNRSGGWSNAMVISSNLPTYNSTVSIGHSEGSWANSLLISHDGPKGTSYGDIVFRRRVWEENIEVQVQGDISVSNAIRSNTQSIEIRSISNEGWGFYAS